MPDVDVAVEGEGAGKVRADDRNLVVKTMYTTFDRLGVRPDGLVVRCYESDPSRQRPGFFRCGDCRGYCRSSRPCVVARRRAIRLAGDAASWLVGWKGIRTTSPPPFWEASRFLGALVPKSGQFLSPRIQTSYRLPLCRTSSSYCDGSRRHPCHHFPCRRDELTPHGPPCSSTRSRESLPLDDGHARLAASAFPTFGHAGRSSSWSTSCAPTAFRLLFPVRGRPCLALVDRETATGATERQRRPGWRGAGPIPEARGVRAALV